MSNQRAKTEKKDIVMSLLKMTVEKYLKSSGELETKVCKRQLLVGLGVDCWLGWGATAGWVGRRLLVGLGGDCWLGWEATAGWVGRRLLVGLGGDCWLDWEATAGWIGRRLLVGLGGDC